MARKGPPKRLGRLAAANAQRQITPEVVEQIRDERRRRDPFTYYHVKPVEDWTNPETGETHRLGPGPTQLQCLQSTANFRLLEGGNQSGKTAHCVAECAMYARGIHPIRPWFGPVNLMVLVTSRQQAQTIWHRKLIEQSMLKGPAYSQPMIPKWEIDKINYDHAGSGKVPRCITLKNGSTIHFNWSGTDATWERIQGNEFDAIFRDEASGNKRLGAEVISRLLTRLDDPSKPLSGWILWSATPTLGNDEHRSFRRKAIAGEEFYAYFRIRPEENPAVSMKARKLAAASMSEHSAKVRMWGTATDDERLLVYAPHWSDIRHLAEDPYEIRETDNLWVGLDPAFGRTGSYVGLVFCAINEREPYRIQVLQAVQYKNGTLREYVDYIKDWLKGRFLEGVVCDPAILKTESTGRSVYSQFQEILDADGVRVERGVLLGRNRYDDTVPLMQSYLDRDLLCLDSQEAGCVELAYQLQSCRTRDETRYSGPHGVVRKDQDLCDALRYLVSLEPCWADRGPNPMGGYIAPPQQRILDPTDLTMSEDMPEDIRIHKQRIQQSIALIDRVTANDPRQHFAPVRYDPIG